MTTERNEMAMVKVKSLRELDVLVGAKLFGKDVSWNEQSQNYGWGVYGAGRLPNYSTNMGDAWAIVEKLNAPPFNKYVSVKTAPISATTQMFKVTIEWFEPAETNPECMSTKAKTTPIAICLAALKTVGIEVELELPDE